MNAGLTRKQWHKVSMFAFKYTLSPKFQISVQYVRCHKALCVPWRNDADDDDVSHLPVSQNTYMYFMGFSKPRLFKSCYTTVCLIDHCHIIRFLQDINQINTHADEMDLFTMVSRRFKKVFSKQEQMKTFPIYDASIEVSELNIHLDPPWIRPKEALPPGVFLCVDSISQ